MNILFLDTETTDCGEQGRLVQLAYKNNSTGNITNEFFKPPVPITIEAMAIHHITNEKISDSPIFDGSETKNQLLKEIENAIVVAHNAIFDITILKNEGVAVSSFIDTLNLSRHIIKSPQHNLQYLRYFLNLSAEGAAHDALGDITVLEALFNYLKSQIADKYSLTSDEEILQKMFELNKTPVMLEIINFGKYRGQLFKEIAEKDPGYLDWLLNSEMQKSINEQNKDLVTTIKNLL